MGRAGVTASGARPGRVWYRRGRGRRCPPLRRLREALGASPEQADLRQRAWYYSRVIADPVDQETVWALNQECWRSSDAGKVFSVFPVQHGDCHDLWIDPADARRMILGTTAAQA